MSHREGLPVWVLALRGLPGAGVRLRPGGWTSSQREGAEPPVLGAPRAPGAGLASAPISRATAARTLLCASPTRASLTTPWKDPVSTGTGAAPGGAMEDGLFSPRPRISSGQTVTDEGTCPLSCSLCPKRLHKDPLAILDAPSAATAPVLEKRHFLLDADDRVLPSHRAILRIRTKRSSS